MEDKNNWKTKYNKRIRISNKQLSLLQRLAKKNKISAAKQLEEIIKLYDQER